MRPLLVCCVTAASLAAAPAAAHAARPSFANFRVTVSGTETTQVDGSEECQDAAGTVVPAHATVSARFSTSRPRVLQFHRFRRFVDVARPRGGSTTLLATGSMQRQSDFVPNGSTPPGCPGGQPNTGCGTTDLTRIVLLVQGGRNEVSIQASRLRPAPGLCLVPAPSFPSIPGPGSDDEGFSTRYTAKVPRALLNRRKRVLAIHGTATTTGSRDEGAIVVTSATTKLDFTMRLRRVHSR